MKKFQDIIILTIGRILIMLTSIISIRIFTTFLSPLEVGRLNILMAICGWFGLVLINPVGMYVYRKIIEWKEKGVASKYTIYFFRYLLIVATFAIFITSVLRHYLNLEIKVLWSFVVGGYILSSSGNTSFLSWLNLFGKRFHFVLFTILTLWFCLLFSTLFVGVISSKSEYWLLGQIFGYFLVLFVAKIMTLRVLNSNDIGNYKNQDFTLSSVFNFGFPLALGTFLYWIHTQGYRFVFQKIAGLDTLGLFTVGFGIGSNLIISLETLFNQYYHPIFYQEIANSDEKQRTLAWNKYAYAFFPAIVLVSIYLGVSGPLLTKVFTGERFHQVGNIIFWGVIAESLRIITSTTALVSHAQIETKPLIVPSIIGTIVAIVGVFIFVRINPFHGAGFALSFGWLLAFIYLFKNMRKLLPIKFPVKRILYSLMLSIPLFSMLIMIKIYKQFTTLQSLLILGVFGSYMLFAQIVLARKWISLPIKIDLIDKIEGKTKLYFSELTGL